MDLDTYISNIPPLHSWDGGRTWNNGGFEAHHLRAFYEMSTAGGERKITILETGAGNSTLAFLVAKPKKLVSIAPDNELFVRITAFAKDNDIDYSCLECIVDRSEWALPRLALSGSMLDIALIDGCHGWPSVFVDFCYINILLKKDGLLVVDDIQLHSVNELAGLLCNDTKRFALIYDFGKSLVFKKLTDDKFLPEWNEQPYLTARSDRSAVWRPVSLSSTESRS